MTYQELVDSIKATVDSHLILRDFGYGALTDIKTVDEGVRTDYPYAFLNPTQSTRTGQSITYRFNLIVMDVVQEDPTNGFANYLKVQSACQQYIDDILASLRFSKPYKDFDLTLNVNLTPFKERFQDTLAGMTATLEIEIPNALNNCIAPTRGSEIVDYGFTSQVREPDPIGQAISTTQPTYDPQGLWHSNSAADRFYTAVYLKDATPKQYRIEVTGTARALESKPIPLVPTLNGTLVDITDPPVPGNTVNYPAGDDTWPEGQVSTADFEWSATYTFTSQQLTGNQQESLNWALRGDAVPEDESQMEFINTDIKIYEL